MLQKLYGTERKLEELWIIGQRRALQILKSML